MAASGVNQMHPKVLKQTTYSRARNEINNNEIWSDTCELTLPIPRPSPAPSIQSFQKIGRQAGRSLKQQTELNVNYFGANDGEIGILKYKTPFSKTLIDPSSNYTIPYSGPYVLEQNNLSPLTMDRRITPPPPLRPNCRTPPVENRRSSVVKIAIPSAKPLQETPRLDEGDNEEEEEKGKEMLDDTIGMNYSPIEEKITSTNNSGDESCPNSGAVGTQIESPTQPNPSSASSSPSVSSLRENQIKKGEEELQGISLLENSPQKSNFISRSHVVVPAVVFLPPEPSLSAELVDLGPSRGGHPGSQSPLHFTDVDAVLPLSTRSFASSVGSFEDLSTPAQRQAVCDILEVGQPQPLISSVVSTTEGEEETVPSSIRDWQFGHVTMKGSSFKPISKKNPRIRHRDIGTDVWSNTNSAEVFDDHTKPIVKGKLNGWKLSGSSSTLSQTSRSLIQQVSKNSILSQQSSKNLGTTTPSSSSLSRIVDLHSRNENASKRAIRRMRAGTSSKVGMKWRGLEDHHQQLICCDAAHVTAMISKIDSIDNGINNNNNNEINSTLMSTTGKRNLTKSCEPKTVTQCFNETTPTAIEPYLRHIMDIKNTSEAITNHLVKEVVNTYDQELFNDPMHDDEEEEEDVENPPSLVLFEDQNEALNEVMRDMGNVNQMPR